LPTTDASRTTVRSGVGSASSRAATMPRMLPGSWLASRVDRSASDAVSSSMKRLPWRLPVSSLC
jgi:hypothetical protein